METAEFDRVGCTPLYNKICFIICTYYIIYIIKYIIYSVLYAYL